MPLQSQRYKIKATKANKHTKKGQSSRPLLFDQD